MADATTDEDELKLEAPKAGLAFRAEMWLMDALLGYWMYLLGIVGVVLIAAFFYGQYSNWARTQQRNTARDIAKIEAKLPAPVSQVDVARFSGEQVDDAQLAEIAGKLASVEGTGPARVEALLKAAELYRLAGNKDEARKSLEAAAAEGSGALKALAESALANAEIDAGQHDAAIARLEALSRSGAGYLSEQAALDLGALYEQLDRKADAGAVYTRFLTDWPKSPRVEEVQLRQQKLGAG